MSTEKFNVIVLRGGISAEREISLQSGAAVAEALRVAGHNVWESDISPDNLSGIDHIFPNGKNRDVIFPALHGVFGEDGQLQSVLEDLDLPFVGSDSSTCEMAMNKFQAKCLFYGEKIPTPAWQVVHQRKFKESWEPLAHIESGGPWMVKPLCEGSSVGCKKCLSMIDVRKHLTDMLPKYGTMMIESFVEGFELTVGIIARKALPVIWIKPASGTYDYEAKYVRDDTEYFFDDIPLRPEILDQVKLLAEQTHRLIGCRHLSRVDIMVDALTQMPYVLEINPMPGFTQHSLLPKAAQRAGVAISPLCDRLVRMAWHEAVHEDPIETQQPAIFHEFFG